MSRSDMIAAPRAASVGATAVPMIALTVHETLDTSVYRDHAAEHDGQRQPDQQQAPARPSRAGAHRPSPSRRR